MRQVEAGVFIGGQITASDIAELATTGVRAIVNNRPDGEECGQPTSAMLEHAAHDAGIAYTFVPIAGGFSPEAVVAARASLQPGAGPVILFCKSGMRSAALWALARVAEGADPGAVIAAAEEAGYDLRAFRPMLLRQAGTER